MTVAIARQTTLKVNALGGEQAMRLALDKAGDIVFEKRCAEWDDADLPAHLDHAAMHAGKLGGYEVEIVRRGYANTESSGEFDADYAVIACSEPQPLFEKPDITDGSNEYAAAVAQKSLQENTTEAPQGKPRPRM